MKYKTYTLIYNKKGKSKTGYWSTEERTSKKGLTKGAFGLFISQPIDYRTRNERKMDAIIDLAYKVDEVYNQTMRKK